MGTESVVKAVVLFDTSQMKEGVAECVGDLQVLAEQSAVTSQTMQSKSQALAQAAQEASAKVTVSDLEMAKSAQLVTAAKIAQAKLYKDLKLGIVDETAGTILLAAAMKTTADAQLQFAASQRAAAAAAVTAAEAVNASSVSWIASFQRIALSARESLGVVQEKLVQTAETAKLTAGGISGGFAALGSLLGAGIAVGFAAHFIGEIAKINVELDHLSVKTGISATSLAGLQLIVKEMGADFEPVANGLVKMEVAQSKAAGGWKPLIAAFQAIGISVAEVKSLNAEQLLQRIAEGFATHTNEAKRAQVALALFGKGGQALIPVLDKEGAALEKNMKLLGATTGVTDESIDAAERYTQTMAELSAMCGKVGQFSLPLVIDAIRWTVGSILALGMVVSAVGESFVRTFEAIARSILPVIELMADLAMGNLAAAKVDFDNFKNGVVDSFATGFKQIHEMWNNTVAEFRDPPKMPKPEVARDPLGDGIGTTTGGKGDRGGRAGKSATGVSGPQGATVTATADTASQLAPPDLSGMVNAYIKAGEEEVRANDQTQRQVLEAFRSSRDEEARMAGEKYSDLEHDSAFEVQQRRMTEAQRLEILRKALADELAAKLSALAALEAVDSGDLAKFQQDENKKLEIVREYNRHVISLDQQGSSIKTEIASPYLNAFTQINRGWLKVQSDMLAGNKRIGQDFRQMALGMVQSMAANFEQMLVSQIQFEFRKAMLHRATVATNVATDAAGSAASVVTAKAADTATGLSAAKTAAKNTYKEVSGWPVVGPFLAPVLAGAAFAAVSSFEMGGVVGGQPGMAVPILAHSGERVLTGSQTTNFERMVNNSSNSGGNIMHNHFGRNNFSGGGGDFKAQWASNEKHITTSLKRMNREGKLRMA